MLTLRILVAAESEGGVIAGLNGAHVGADGTYGTRRPRAVHGRGQSLIPWYRDNMSERQTTVRMPDALHERLRREVSVSRTPANAIIIDAIRRELNERDFQRGREATEALLASEGGR